MRLLASHFMSLDGVVQAPGGPDEDTDGGFAHGGWSHPFFDPEVMGAVIDAGLSRTEALLFGRRTWQVMAAAWPDRAGDPFADRMNAIRKYVVSRTLEAVDLHWQNSQLLGSEDAAGSVADLKASGEGVIQVMGSSALVRYLIGHGLVDEFLVMINPIILGGGKRLFPDDGSLHELQLQELEQTSTGVVIARYTKV